MSNMPTSQSPAASPAKDTAAATRLVDSSFQDSLISFLDKYRSRLTKDEEKEFEGTTLFHVKTKIIQIQDQQGKEQKLINMTRITKFLTAMEEWGIVVDGFSDSSVFLAFVWGPTKALLQYASTFTESFEALLEAYDEIGQRLPSLKQHQALFGQYAELRSALRLMYCDILQFQLKALRFFSGPAWKKAFHSLWKDFKTKYSGILRKLAQHKDIIEGQAQMSHVNQYQIDRKYIFEAIHTYTTLRQKLIDDIDDRVESERRKQYGEAQAWLGAPSALPEHEKACEKREAFAGTGTWLFQKPEMKSWKDADTPDSSILWLNGMPGAGKTVLSSQVIEECQSIPHSHTSFFYCVEKDPNKNTFISIIKALLSQALHQSREDLLPQCYDRLKKNSESILQSPTQAAALLESFLQRITQNEAIVDQQTVSQRQYIIVDGLDECEDREWSKVIQFFQKTVQAFDKTHFGRLRVLLVSQHTDQIEKALKPEQAMRAAVSISLKSKDNEGDIKFYVQRRVKALQERWRFNDDVAADIVRETCEGAEGMFLYARLVIDNLLQQREHKHFDEERRKAFPQGIRGAYERILNRIRRDAESNSNRWPFIRTILGWLVCARRFLKWQEIELAYSIDPDDESMNFAYKRLPYHIREDCGSLIEASSDEYVRFVHRTASMCILLAGFANQLLAEASLTTKSLQYLSMSCFRVDLSPELLLSFALSGQYIFQEYALANWSTHFHALCSRLLTTREKHAAATANSVSLSLDGDVDVLDEQIAELEDALRRFIDTYKGAFLATSEEKMALGIWNQQRIAADNEALWDDLCTLQVHVQQHSRRPFDVRNKVSIEILGKAFDRIRTFLEDPSQAPFKFKLSSADNSRLREYYGDSRYKCPRLNCPRFVDGFQERKARQKHVDRHDRPFRCEVPECPGELGFTSAHDLQKHQRSFHPTPAEEAETFDPFPDTKNETTAKWPCQHCPKRFTRGFHLRNHIRTHSNDRPFSCTECGKAFTRDYDRKRHEKTVHTRK